MKNQNIAPRILGGILIISAIAGIVYNFQTKSIFYGKNYLHDLALHSSEIRLGTLIEILMGLLNVLGILLVLPYFEKINRVLSNALFGFRITAFAVSILEAGFALSLLRLSEEFMKADLSQVAYFKTVGLALAETHETVHLLRMLITPLPVLFFYLITYKSRHVPRFIAIWGFVSVPLMITGMILGLYKMPSNSLLLMVFGLNQLFLAFWLVVKGFNFKQHQIYETENN